MLKKRTICAEYLELYRMKSNCKSQLTRKCMLVGVWVCVWIKIVGKWINSPRMTKPTPFPSMSFNSPHFLSVDTDCSDFFGRVIRFAAYKIFENGKSSLQSSLYSSISSVRAIKMSRTEMNPLLFEPFQGINLQCWKRFSVMLVNNWLIWLFIQSIVFFRSYSGCVCWFFPWI